MLPIALGMKGVLITRSMTPIHEINIVREKVDQGLCKMVDSLEALYSAIKDLHYGH